MKAVKKNRKKTGIWIIVWILVILGIAGGILIKLGFYQKAMDQFMSNREANRLISYLGINDYEYTDRLGSNFTVKQDWCFVRTSSGIYAGNGQTV